MTPSANQSAILPIQKSTLQLLRIPFSYFLMPVFFFALSQVHTINLLKALLCFIILHLFIYPASNGYNSYMDNDETSIGGIENPMKPTKQLFVYSVLFDMIGLVLALMISKHFFILVLLYMIASRAYSFKGIRLKRFPILGFLTVITFQGGFTFWMVYSSIATNHTSIIHSSSIYPAIIACSFLIAGVYPLTQIYQHEADKANGDITISYQLGIRGTFIFTAAMFLLASAFLYVYFDITNSITQFFILQLFLLPVILYFLSWFIKVIKNPEEASFKNTMRMNWIASTSMNVCFILLLILKNHL